MKTIKVDVAEDYLETLASTKPLSAVTELIWNALDADARRVRVSVVRGALAGIESISVEDDGEGMNYAFAEEAFSHLGGSWKRNKVRTTKGRFLHGKEGKGRFRAFALGSRIDWTSRFRDNGDVLEYTLTGQRGKLAHFELGDFKRSDQNDTGTDVQITQITKDFQTLEGEGAVQSITEQFAMYLKQYPDVSIIYNGMRVDPAVLMDREITLSLVPITVDGQKYEVGIHVIEWKGSNEKTVLLCDADGFPLAPISPRVPASGIGFTAYVRSPLVRELYDRGVLNFVEELAPAAKQLVDVARDELRRYFRERAAEKASTLVDQWQKEQVYPYEGPARTSVERVERQVFDVVAYNVHSYLPNFEELDSRSKRLTFHLLKGAVENDPSSLRKIIGNLIDLPKERRDELAKLLDRMSLDRIITASKIVADRLDFLEGLRALVFDPVSKQQLKERRELHLLLNDHTWIFGEEFNLTLSDKGLTKVLEAHLKTLSRKPEKGTKVRRADGSAGIVDLLLSRTVPQTRNDREHLVIELKAPKVTLNSAHADQIMEYAHAVASEPQFRDINTRWTFFLVSDDYDDNIRRRITQKGRAKGILDEPESRDEPQYTIWVKTWGQIIDDCKGRLRFFQENFDYQADEESGIAFLRETHEKLLPKKYRSKQAGDAEGDGGESAIDTDAPN